MRKYPLSPPSRLAQRFTPLGWWIQLFALLSGMIGVAGLLPAHARPEKPSRSTHFPVPDIIRPNVEFWKQVYAQRSVNEVLIHDAEDLGIIYEVVDLRRLFPNREVSDSRQWRKIEQIKKGYRHILLSLAKKVANDIETMSEKERQVLALFGADVRAKRLRRAARNVRAQRGLYEQFREGLIRSGLYLDFIERVFEEEGLPWELSVLPHVESSFNYKAYSKIGAAGIWQFIRSTGRLFLKINYEVDERFDPIRATEAAARLLKLNYETLGSWPLAITAYNHGLQGMKRAVRKLRTRDFGEIYKRYRSRSFGFASRNFYAEFLAALEIVENYQAYFGQLEFHRPARFNVIELPRRVPTRSLLEAFDVDLHEFAELNPALRRPVLQGRRRLPKGYPIRLPWREGQDVQVTLASLLLTQEDEPELVDGEYYRVRRGDSLSEIARRYRVPLYTLLEYNDDLEDVHLIREGQLLRIPINPRSTLSRKRTLAGGAVEKSASAPLAVEMPASGKKDSEVTVTEVLAAEGTATGGDKGALGTGGVAIAAGDDGVPVEALVPPGAAPVVSTGPLQKIVLLPEEQPELTVDIPPVDARTRTVRVEPEETLGHFAEWLEVPTQRLRNLNGLRYGESLRIGQRIKLTFAKVPPEVFERRRNEYHRGIQEDFFANFRIEGVQTHTVRRGETIWVLCNRIYEVPYWLVKKYNPERDLQRLKPGDQLLIPLVGALRGEEFAERPEVAR
jgi:membrane-bound lytic murein transglycosylase D